MHSGATFYTPAFSTPAFLTVSSIQLSRRPVWLHERKILPILCLMIGSFLFMPVSLQYRTWNFHNILSPSQRSFNFLYRSVSAWEHRMSLQIVQSCLLSAVGCRSGFRIVDRKTDAWSSWTLSAPDVISSSAQLIIDFVRCFYRPWPQTSFSTFTATSTSPLDSRRRLLHTSLVISFNAFYLIMSY